MFSGRRKNKKTNNEAEGSSSRNNEIVEEIDMNDVKYDTMRSRASPSDTKNGDTSHFYEDVDRVYSRGQSISIEDAVEEKPKLQRALKARHVSQAV
jgi:hypothetical protein